MSEEKKFGFSKNLQPWKKFTKEQKTEMVRLFIEEGKSNKEICELFGAGKDTVARVINKKVPKDLPKRNKSNGGQGRAFTKDEIEKIVRLYTEQNISQTNIAKLFDCSQATVSRILIRNGIEPQKFDYRGENHPSWRGGRTSNGKGYIMVWIDVTDPYYNMASSIGYVLEHRLVMAKHLGRSLTSDESVHHIDGNTQNNDISNLQLRQGKHGSGVCHQCSDCGSVNIITVSIKD